MRTPEQWLDLHARDKKECAVELAKALRGKPWKHTRNDGADYSHWICFKCGSEGPNEDDCPIPDPIDLNDWNGAMDARGTAVAKVDDQEFVQTLLEVFGGGTEADVDQTVAYAQPIHYYIAAAVAKEGK